MRSMLLTVALVATALTGVYANDFENALNILVSNNLESKAAIKRGVSEVETMRAENVLPGPEAEFSRVWGTNAEAGNKLGVSVSQGFDWARTLCCEEAGGRHSRVGIGVSKSILHA